MDVDVDVVVVGAGLAGLTCARALERGGARVALIEARDRVGGRTLSKTVGKGTIDLGGQWLGANQPKLEALAKELGVATFPTFHQGKKVLSIGGKVSTYGGSIPSLPLLDLVDMQRTLWALDRRTAKVICETPLDTPDADELDGMSLESFKMQSIRSKRVRALVDAVVRVVFGAEPRDLSLLYFLLYSASGGGLMKLAEIEGGAQQTRFVDGAQSLSIRLAEKLKSPPMLGVPARKIHQDEHGVVVYGDTITLRAKRVVVALPPTLAGRIEYDPLLPVARDQLHQRMSMGATVKCLAMYDRAFWREDGFSGEIVTDGDVCVSFDNTSHDGAQPCLVAFVVGEAARRWSSRSEKERREVVLGAFARAFGDKARNPTIYLEQDWSTERWTGGCPVGILGTGGLTSTAAALRIPTGRIHWAGTETAVKWMGYMEGAIGSGERAAREVLAGL
ncbi:MAG: FAD-dependent oxidoreductase [Polyangiaceae bacterium]